MRHNSIVIAESPWSPTTFIVGPFQESGVSGAEKQLRELGYETTVGKLRGLHDIPRAGQWDNDD